MTLNCIDFDYESVATPSEIVEFLRADGELALHTHPDRAYDEMGYDVNDFDLIFAYPWPNDVELIREIFDRCAARGAMLLTYHDVDSIALYRKD